MDPPTHWRMHSPTVRAEPVEAFDACTKLPSGLSLSKAHTCSPIRDAKPTVIPGAHPGLGSDDARSSSAYGPSTGSVLGNFVCRHEGLRQAQPERRGGRNGEGVASERGHACVVGNRKGCTRAAKLLTVTP